MTLNEYLKRQGRGAIVELAMAINAPRPDVSKWANGTRPIPAWRCVSIEKQTGGIVTRQEMRASDWSEIWPELKG